MVETTNMETIGTTPSLRTFLTENNFHLKESVALLIIIFNGDRLIVTLI
ncbi:hypothetical protein [Mesobacillus jeotgali]|nr:hypothetical protein [Mesobacillus jeotgali]UYZ20508.1 hypothetical protein FOF60_15685 [Mesobacillus jeotgali]